MEHTETTVIYEAKVVVNNDPNGALRVRVTCPQVYGTQLSGWAKACVPLGASPSPPAVGTSVWLTFIGDDKSHPMYLGTVR